MQFAARTEFPRLSAGELVYMGLLRTRLEAILPAAKIGGRVLPLAPEIFAIMAGPTGSGPDIPGGHSCDTADGAGKDRQSALRRLARSVCANLEEIGEGAAMAIARQA